MGGYTLPTHGKGIKLLFSAVSQDTQTTIFILIVTARLSFRQTLNVFPGNYNVSGINRESQAALMLPKWKAMLHLCYPHGRFEASSTLLSLQACAHACADRKATLLNSRGLSNRTDVRSLQIRQEIERWWSHAALLMKKRNVIIEVESP